MKKIFCVVFSTFLFCFLFVGCNKKTNELDTSFYINSSVYSKLFGSNSTTNSTLDKYTSSDIESCDKYTVIQFNTKADWSFGLYLEKIEFDVYKQSNIDIDIDITISNLENAENYNSTQDILFYHKTLTIKEQLTHISLDINDTFGKGESTISIEINNSCFNSDSSLKWTISNLKLYGEHIEAKY